MKDHIQEVPVKRESQNMKSLLKHISMYITAVKYQVMQYNLSTVEIFIHTLKVF